MTDTTQTPKPNAGGFTMLHGIAAGGAISTAGDIISYTVAWVRAGQMPMPDEGQEVALAGLALMVLAVLSPIGKALTNLALAWIKKWTPKDAP